MSPDTLSDVLHHLRLRGAVFFALSASSEWAAEAPPAAELAPLLMPGAEHVMEYHAVAHGSCWAGMPGGAWVQLSAGDVVMFPHGDAHVVASRPGLRGSTDRAWLAGLQPDGLPSRIAFGGPEVAPSGADDGRPDVTLVCGFLGCDLRPFDPLISALPPLVHLRATEADGWVATLTRQALAESRARRAGGQALLARMSEMMFVDAVRRFADRLPAHSAGWLAGLRDRVVGRTLALLHAQPARPWTMAELGRQVGLSRSALHERFVQLVGMPPMQYLAQWRMQSAARLLLETRATVAAIALDVGYESEAAFARAFKRSLGKPPAAWRRERMAAAV
ncbi:MAG TPA: AraC family transcriptional regulator [Albitalea sp.]|uniref:AraC family transcriptional regulator n=1 Tax=Piscinibacter sp. TaxID=1903157 RepID=UPI002ED12FF4